MNDELGAIRSRAQRAGFAPMVVLAATVFAVAAQPGHVWAAIPAKELIVCADPNNLPFSNRAGAGFENKLVELLARDLGAQVRYVWWAQRRGYARRTLNEDKCEIRPGVASGVENVATTPPYYRSTYVFITRADRPLGGLTLDDARLKSLSIGVQMVGDNAMNTPPAHALASRSLTANVRGYMIYGDYDRPNPAAEIVTAVAHGDIDVALVWGPLAGYFAHRSAIPLRVTPVTASPGTLQWPMVYDISVGVSPTAPTLRLQIESALEKEKPAIQALLGAYYVPQSSAISFEPADALRQGAQAR